MRRWPTNLTLVVLGSALARGLGPLTAIGAAMAAEAAGFGLFNILAAPAIVVALVCVVVLDFALYVQHRLLHVVPLLWRLHAPHHADPHLDVTTGLRFHPLEFFLSMVWKAAIAALLGAPV
jgi:sterol desaturase/sphingolipid hydroxylase (fatty acid hydroxylase superfamily)